MHFEIEQLISDLGGAPTVAKRLKICRTIPYGWIRRDFISSTYLSQIKMVWPRLNLNSYFKPEITNDISAKRSPRASRTRLGGNTDTSGHEAASS